jgi:hypothetical protein
MSDLRFLSACGVGVVAALVVTATPAADLTLAAAPTAQAATPMAGGGEVSLRRDGDTMHVVVVGPRAGLASLCVGDESRVRILHASAAVGEATYARSGESWTLTSGFDFKLRESRTGSPSESERRQFLTEMGWVANASNAGDPRREFTIRLAKTREFVGVTFYVTSEPAGISHWPAQMDDDCRAVKVAQGYLPERASFRPDRWHQIK